jgi:hypothetical protein
VEGEAVEACAERLVILQRRRDEGRERHILAAPLRTGRGRPTRCGRRRQRREPVHLALVRGFSVEGCEQASTAQVLDDAADAVLEHVAHLARRQARQLREGHAVGAQLAIAAVQEEHMQMWMELQVGARRIATASRITSVDRTARASSSIRTADGMNRLEAVRPRCSWEKRLSSRR